MLGRDDAMKAAHGGAHATTTRNGSSFSTT
jgi:hypothetical protein